MIKLKRKGENERNNIKMGLAEASKALATLAVKNKYNFLFCFLFVPENGHINKTFRVFPSTSFFFLGCSFSRSRTKT
jgi:hypothetical protein